MIQLNDEMSQDFLDYCYQTNSQRAFPDIDGLKPGQRACLFEMFRKKYFHNKSHVKSAKVSGGVIADLWPHGDVAIYETFARMAQPFTNNLPLCEFHGSCGNQIIPEPANQRYTEVRLSKEGFNMFEGIDKNAVPMILNFDETMEWPEVLPSPIPYLFINGSEGIGTTIAQKFLPFDAKEISEAYKKFLEDGTIDYTLVPSFPTGGTIINKDDVESILKTGEGKVVLRAKADIKKNIISITEICYQTCVRDLMEEFQKLYVNDEIPDIEDIQNLSGKKGIRIDFICKKGSNPAAILETLYKKTSLQKSYSANQNLLINKIPTRVNLEDYFSLLKEHNDNCLVRECSFEKNKAEVRAEECEGLIIATANIDEVISIVKNSNSKDDAKNNLKQKYNLTDLQCDCILKMTIGQLTKLDSLKITNELNDLRKKIKELNGLLNDKTLRLSNIINNLQSIIDKIKTVRKTEVMQLDINDEDKDIQNVVAEDVVVFISQSGLIKRTPKANFKIQNRNGVGAKNSDDAILDLVSTNTVDNLILFSSEGKMYKLLVDKIPNATNTSKGVPIASLIKLDSNEEIVAVSSLNRKTFKKYVLFFTKCGMIKKTNLEEYKNVKKSSGIIAIKLKENDEIANITFADEEEVLLITEGGMSIRFETKDIASVGRTALGVKAINLKNGDKTLKGIVLNDLQKKIGIFSEEGKGKKVSLNEFSTQGKGGRGIKCSDKQLAGAELLEDADNILIIGDNNNICISAKSLPDLGRYADGNVLIKNNNIAKVIKL